MEICGHEIFPELVESRPLRPKVGEGYHRFNRMVARLEREENRAKAVQEAARLARQQAMEEEGDFYLSNPEEYFADASLRAKVQRSQATGLLDLSPEVLILIVSYAAGYPDKLKPAEMKTMRLVHPQLGNLRYLKQQLFRTFILSPDPDKLWRLHQTAESIAPFVSEIIFRPVIVDKSKIPPSRRKDTDARIKKALAPRIDKVIADGKVQSTWVYFLQRLNPNAAIRIRYSMHEQAYGFTSPGPPRQPFLQTVVASLVTSAFRTSELELTHCTDNASIWSNIAGWKELDLSALKTLSISLTPHDLIRRRIKSDEQLQTFTQESVCLLQCLLEKSSSTLQNLTIERDHPDFLSGDDLPLLPALRSLKLVSPTAINATRLAAWLSSLPNIQAIALRHVKIEGGPSLLGWKPIFDAIRSSQQNCNMWVEFEGYLNPCPITFFHFEHRTSEPVEDDQGYVRNGRSDIVKMVKRYVSRIGEWDDCGG